MSQVPGVRAFYEFQAKDHWLVDAAESLDAKLTATMSSSGDGKTYFVIVADPGTGKISPKQIMALIKTAGSGRMPAKATIDSEGIFVIGMPRPKHDRVTDILEDVVGRISLYSDKPNRLRVLVETPDVFGQFEGLKKLRKIGEDLDALPQFKLLRKPQIEKTHLLLSEFLDTHIEPIPRTDPELARFDKRDVKIATELFRSGYYDPNRRDKETLENISKKVGISKPTLIKRKKRMEAMGIEAILSPRISEEGKIAAANALREIVKWKKIS